MEFFSSQFREIQNAWTCILMLLVYCILSTKWCIVKTENIEFMYLMNSLGIVVCLCMLLCTVLGRLPVSTGERTEQKASLRRDRSHDHESSGGLPQLPVHSAADRRLADSHGGEADVCSFSTESIQRRESATSLSLSMLFVRLLVVRRL